MFTYRAIAILSILFFAILFAGIYLSKIGKSDYAVYQKLIESSEIENQSDSSPAITARQQRSRVRKEFFFNKEGSRLHFILHSKQSELVFSDEGEHTEMVENMAGVACFIQEELYYLLPDGREVLPKENGALLFRNEDPELPSSWLKEKTDGLCAMQKVRYLESEKAVYYYKNNSFIANEVLMQKLIAKGHAPIETLDGLEPIMKGFAQTIEFSLGGNDLNFRAYHLKAKFYSPKGLM